MIKITWKYPMARAIGRRIDAFIWKHGGRSMRAMSLYMSACTGRAEIEFAEIELRALMREWALHWKETRWQPCEGVHPSLEIAVRYRQSALMLRGILEMTNEKNETTSETRIPPAPDGVQVQDL